MPVLVLRRIALLSIWTSKGFNVAGYDRANSISRMLKLATPTIVPRFAQVPAGYFSRAKILRPSATQEVHLPVLLLSLPRVAHLATTTPRHRENQSAVSVWIGNTSRAWKQPWKLASILNCCLLAGVLRIWVSNQISSLRKWCPSISNTLCFVLNV